MPFKNPHPLYSVWQGMKRRCYNENSKMFHRYGGRGITVCDRWLHDFQAFITDMGERPKNYTLERIDNDLGYFPKNCIWTSRQEQQLNLERTHRFYVEGKVVIPAVISKMIGVKTDTIINRILRGCSLEEVMSSNRLIPPMSDANRIALKEAGKRRTEALTHCKNGHEFTPENTYITKQAWKRCRTCHNEKMRRLNALKR